jgi:hypothetical protein
VLTELSLTLNETFAHCDAFVLGSFLALCLVRRCFGLELSITLVSFLLVFLFFALIWTFAWLVGVFPFTGWIHNVSPFNLCTKCIVHKLSSS